MFWRRWRSGAKAQALELRAWRCSAKKVNRAWHALLASDLAEREVRRSAYVMALDDEQRAAERVSRMLQLDAPPRRAASRRPNRY